MSTLYKNTGVARASKLVIHRKVDGVDITGFPITFDLLSAISGYPAITVSDLRKMSDNDYAARRDAFIAYAASQTGYTASSAGSIITDTVSCPIEYVTP